MSLKISDPIYSVWQHLNVDIIGKQINLPGKTYAAADSFLLDVITDDFKHIYA